MKVVIDGVEYQPRHSTAGALGGTKPVWRLMADARKHNGWTLAEVSKRSGLSTTAVHRAECGVCGLLATFKLAEVYGIAPDILAASVLRRV